MTLQQAIQFNTDLLELPIIAEFDHRVKAIKLLIEAGKRLERERVLHYINPDAPLPGETNE